LANRVYASAKKPRRLLWTEKLLRKVVLMKHGLVPFTRMLTVFVEVYWKLAWLLFLSIWLLQTVLSSLSHIKLFCRRVRGVALWKVQRSVNQTECTCVILDNSFRNQF
jgi:hypothetical protein